MVTIKQALTNRHSSHLCRTIASLAPGEAFKWCQPRAGGEKWCVKVSHMDNVRVQTSTSALDAHMRVCTSWSTKQHLWMYIEGPDAGQLFYDDGVEGVFQP